MKQLVGHFEENWGRLLSPLEIEELTKLNQEEGYSTELIYEALRIAVKNQKGFVGYVAGVLRRMRAQGIQTPQQLKAAESEKERLRNPKITGDDLNDAREAMIAAELMWGDGSKDSLAEIERLKQAMTRPLNF